MFIEKTFHFYAAHRNENLKDKCRSLHGHTYYLTCRFKVERDPSNRDISVLFSDYDDIESLIKERYDHSLLVHINDPFYSCLVEWDKVQGFEQKRTVFPRVTSVENVCYDLFAVINAMGFINLQQIELKETTSSTVVYTREDYEADKVAFDDVERWCECVFDGGLKNCLICGRSQWQFKIDKRKHNAESTEAGTAIPPN